MADDLNRYLPAAAAAHFLGMTTDTLKHLRNDDRRRAERGEEPKGPPCVRRGLRYFYRVNDLERWMERNSTPVAQRAAR